MFSYIGILYDITNGLIVYDVGIQRTDTNEVVQNAFVFKSFFYSNRENGSFIVYFPLKPFVLK